MLDLLNPFLQDCHPTPNMPRVILSWAQSVDGFLTYERGKPTAISSSEALILTHTIRSVCQGILVGVNTVISDDPILTCRLQGKNDSPIPIILDSKLCIPMNSRILSRSPIIFTTNDCNQQKKLLLENLGIDIVETAQDKRGYVDLQCVLSILKSQFGIDNLMVEGGATVLREFMAQKLADLIVLTISPKFFGTGVALASSTINPLLPFELKSTVFRQIGPDMIILGYP